MALPVSDALKTAATSTAGSIPLSRIEVFPVAGVISESKGLKREIFDGVAVGSDDLLWGDTSTLMTFNWGNAPPLGISPAMLTDGITWTMQWSGHILFKKPPNYNQAVTFKLAYVSTGYINIHLGGSGRTSSDTHDSFVGSSPNRLNIMGSDIRVGGTLVWMPISVTFERGDGGSNRQLKEERFTLFWKDNVDNIWRVVGSDITCRPGGRYVNTVGAPVTAIASHINSDNNSYRLTVHKVGSAYHFHKAGDATEFPFVPGDTNPEELNPGVGNGDKVTLAWSDTVNHEDVVEIFLVAGKEQPYVLKHVSDIQIESPDDAASVFTFTVPVTTAAFDKNNVTSDNMYTYDLSTDSFGILRKNRFVKTHLGYQVDSRPELVQRFTGVVTDVQPRHTVAGDGTQAVLDVECIDARVFATDPPLVGIEDVAMGGLPNELSYDIAGFFTDDVTDIGPNGSVRPITFDGWNLASVIRVVLYQRGFTSSQLFAKDVNGGFLIEDRVIYLERTRAYPLVSLSELTGEGATSSTDVWVPSPKVDLRAAFPSTRLFSEIPPIADPTLYEEDRKLWRQNANIVDYPYLIVLDASARAWEELRELCQSYGLDFGLNTLGEVYMRYPDNPQMYHCRTVPAATTLTSSETAGNHVLDVASVDNFFQGQRVTIRSSSVSSEDNVIQHVGGDSTFYLQEPLIFDHNIGAEVKSFDSRNNIDNYINVGASWTLTEDSRAIGNVVAERDGQSKGQLSIQFRGIGIKLIFARRNNTEESWAVVSIDDPDLHVGGVDASTGSMNILDASTGDTGHIDWTDNVQQPGFDDSVPLHLPVAMPGLSGRSREYWYYSDGIFPELGYNPTIFTICNNLTYGTHTCYIDVSSGEVYLEGWMVIQHNVDKAHHDFTQNDIMVLDITNTTAALVNDVIVAGRTTGVAGDNILSRAVDLGSIGDENSPNFTGRRSTWLISSQRISSQDRADYLARHIIEQYSRGIRNPVVTSSGLPWLENGDAVSISDLRSVAGVLSPFIGMYSDGDLTRTQRLGTDSAGISTASFLRYWIRNIRESMSSGGDAPRYTMDITSSSLPPLPAYEPVVEPDQGNVTTAISEIDLTIDKDNPGDPDIYNPYLSDLEGKYVNIKFDLNWHARFLAVRIIAGELVEIDSRDDLAVGQVVNVLVANTGFTPAGRHEYRWDGWVSTGQDEGFFAGDGDYYVEIETERSLTGHGFYMRTDSQIPGIFASGSLYGITTALDSSVFPSPRYVVTGVVPFTNGVDNHTTPPLLYDDSNDGRGLQIDVTLENPAQVFITIRVKYSLSTGGLPNNHLTEEFAANWYDIHIRGDESPILDPGDYSFYFRPATQLIVDGQLLDFRGSYFLDNSLSVAGNWYVAWNFHLATDIVCFDKAGQKVRVMDSDVSASFPSGYEFTWGGPSEDTYPVGTHRFERFDVLTHWTYFWVQSFAMPL